MTEATGIDTTTPWCGSCERHTEYQTRIVRTSDGDAGAIAICEECNQTMYSPSWQRKILRVFHYFAVPMVLLVTPVVLFMLWGSLPEFILWMMASAAPITLAIMYCITLKSRRFLRKFEAWEARQSQNLYGERE